MDVDSKATPLALARRAGRKGVAFAVVMTVVVPLALGLLFYPIAHMELRDLPFGVLTLDEGVQTPVGEVNAGDEMADRIESGGLAESLGGSEGASGGSSLSDAITFRAFGSQEELDAAFDANEIYGAIIIPENFSQLQAGSLLASQAAGADLTALAGAAGTDVAALAGAAGTNPSALAGAAEADASALAESAGIDPSALATGAGADGSAQAAQTTDAGTSSDQAEETERPVIEIVIDYAKSPLIASQMQTGMTSAFAGASDRLDVEVSVIDEGPAASVDVGGGNPMGGMLSQMAVLMPLLICSIVAGVLAVKGLGVRDRETASGRAKAYAATLAVDAVAAATLSLMLFWVISFVAGLPADFAGFFGYCWVASFFLMVFAGGLACVRGRLAIVVGALILLLGMTSAYLPVESLPAFWRDWVVPWAPEYYLGNGLREVVFAGGAVWNAGTACTGVYALVGLCFAALGIGVAGRRGRRDAADE